MNQDRTLVFVGAHPDDETFGMGATLAKYVAEGVKVYYICATRGEAGSVEPRYLKDYASIAELRCAELSAAAKELRLAGVYYLNYRDSGMNGSKDNQNPSALFNAPIEQVAERIVKIFRELKPDVVITHDPSGGYNHPDHIATHKATVKAFYACNDPLQYPENGMTYQPKKLYYGVRSRRLLKIMIKLMGIFGSNVHKYGRNHDIDLTKMTEINYPIHAVIKLPKSAMETRIKAAACHASQGGGRQSSRGNGVMGFANSVYNLKNRIYGYQDSFMREYPVFKGGRKEKDLFEGIK